MNYLETEANKGSPWGGFNFPNSPNTAGVTTQPSSGWFGDFDLTGQGGANFSAALSGFGSIANALTAYKQYGLGKDTLNLNKASFNRNLANQAKVTNAQIDDRELRRASENPSYAGDFARIQAAAEASAAKRRVSGAPV